MHIKLIIITVIKILIKLIHSWQKNYGTCIYIFLGGLFQLNFGVVLVLMGKMVAIHCIVLPLSYYGYDYYWVTLDIIWIVILIYVPTYKWRPKSRSCSGLWRCVGLSVYITVYLYIWFWSSQTVNGINDLKKPLRLKKMLTILDGVQFVVPSIRECKL